MLGTAIGHEIGHAFDSTGARFDKDGNRKNWWTDTDAENFRKKNEKLAAYLSSIHAFEGNYTRGSIKAGEAAADMTGMKCMLRIAKKALHLITTGSLEPMPMAGLQSKLRKQPKLLLMTRIL